MYKVIIKNIPEHIAYMHEYHINDYNDFFDAKTGGNILFELEERMRKDNPDVIVPDIPYDYNYIEHEAGKPVVSPMDVKYYDMVDKKGRDTDEYKFVKVPEVKAATVLHRGPYESIGKTYEFLYEWIEKNGHAVAGPGRSSAINGPWDRDRSEDYLMEVQIPIT